MLHVLWLQRVKSASSSADNVSSTDRAFTRCVNAKGSLFVLRDNPSRLRVMCTFRAPTSFLPVAVTI